MGRIEILCSYIDACESFADVGCDHGYCAEHALKSGKCRRAVITDISAKCLEKAETLLAPYIKSGVCKPVCCDGLAGVPTDTEQVLIAGMGGEEIIKILTEGFIPEKFILQPMKNADKLRKFLIESGCKITVDDIFKEEEYYIIGKGEWSGGSGDYTYNELCFGKDSLKNPLLKEYAAAELIKREGYLKSCKGASRQKILNEINLLTEAIK